MSLDKNDLEQIEKIVDHSVGTSEKRLQGEIKSLGKSLRGEIKDTENRVIAVITREITDLAAVNRAVIGRLDKIDDLEKRMIRVETKLGIAN